MTPEPAIYVLNLDRSPDRLAEMRRRLDAAGLALERVPAVDGRDAIQTDNYDTAANRQHYLAPLSRSEIACFLTHRLAWRTFLEGAQPAAIFLEDDVRPLGTAADTAALLAQLASAPHARLCKLNSLRPPTKNRAPVRLRRCLLPSLTAAALAMNRSAAQALLGFTEKFHEPVDIAIQRWWDHGVEVFEVDPPLFHEERDRTYASTIRDPGHSPAEGRLLRELRRPFFQAHRFAAMLHAVARRGFS